MKVLPYLQLFLTLTLVSLVIFGLDIFRILSLPKTAFYTLTNPLSLGLYQTSQGVGRQFYFIFASRFAAQENKALKDQLGQLTTENASIRRKLAEANAKLDQEQKLDPAIYNTIPAHPLGVDDGILRIDKGVNDGVNIGQTLVYKDNFIGRVISATEKGASVMLSSHPQSEILAFSINKEGKARGILEGQFETELIFKDILHGEPIEKGDLVYSEGTEGYSPRGLVLGIVSEVFNQEHEVFKEAKIKKLFDIRDFELVFVIVE